MSFEELRDETIVELPARLETAALFSPVAFNMTQTATAVNAISVGGNQLANAQNLAVTAINVG